MGNLTLSKPYASSHSVCNHSPKSRWDIMKIVNEVMKRTGQHCWLPRNARQIRPSHLCTSRNLHGGACQDQEEVPNVGTVGLRQSRPPAVSIPSVHLWRFTESHRCTSQPRYAKVRSSFCSSAVVVAFHKFTSDSYPSIGFWKGVLPLIMSNFRHVSTTFPLKTSWA